MNGLRALMILESYVGNWRIDNGDDYGLHFPLRCEARAAANVLRDLGAPSFSNYRQVTSWGRGVGFDAVIDDEGGNL